MGFSIASYGIIECIGKNIGILSGVPPLKSDIIVLGTALRALIVIVPGHILAIDSFLSVGFSGVLAVLVVVLIRPVHISDCLLLLHFILLD